MVLTLPDAVPPSVTVVTVGSHVMLNVAGIRIRMSLAAVIVTDDASVTVTTLAVVVACPTVKLWFAAEEMVAPAAIVIVLSSVAAVAPPVPAVTSSRLSAAETAVKLVNLSPVIVSVCPAVKFDVTFNTTVLLPSS